MNDITKVKAFPRIKAKRAELQLAARNESREVDAVHDNDRVPRPHMRISNALKALAEVWGTDEHGWFAQLDATETTLQAYLGKRHAVVATATHWDLHIAMRILAWELEELLFVRERGENA